MLSKGDIEHTFFPIGHLKKNEVRRRARQRKLPSAERPDSQGICFVGPVNVAEFLREHLPVDKGPVLNTKGEEIGEHDGVWFYTEGQRRGFRLFKSSYPLYVIYKDLDENALVVGRGKATEVSRFTVGGLNWIGEAPEDGVALGVRIRHLGEIMLARIEKRKDTLTVSLSHPARGVAPGQSAVFYQGEAVLGGGVIESFLLTPPGTPC
jgi:tRNA-specific 2-thiouridylase